MRISATRFVLAIVGLTVTLTGARRAAASDPMTTQLIALDKAMQRSVVDRDPKKFASFLTDDYILVTGSGKIMNKAAVVAEIDAPDVKVEVNESSDWSVRVQGDTALVIAVLHEKGVDHGKPYEARVRYTDTWVRQGSTWRNISGHASRLPDTAKH